MKAILICTIVLIIFVLVYLILAKILIKTLYVLPRKGYYKQEDYAEVESILLNMKKSFEKLPHYREYNDYAGMLSIFGILYFRKGDYANAEKYFLDALNIRKQTRGEGHFDYSNDLHRIGRLYCSIGDYTGAEKYYLNSLNIKKQILRKRRSYYAGLLSDIGSLYCSMRNYTEAEKYYFESLNIIKWVLRKDHPIYVLIIHNFGWLYQSIGDYEKAEKYYLESFNMGKRTSKKDKPCHAGYLNAIGDLYNSMGDYSKSEKYLLESFSIKKLALGEDHPNYASSLTALGELYINMKEYGKALLYIKEVNRLYANIVNRYFSFLSKRQREIYWSTRSSSFELSYSLSWFYTDLESNILNYDNALFSKGLLIRTSNTIRDAIYSSGKQPLIDQYKKLCELSQRIANLQQKEDRDEKYIEELEKEADDIDKSLTQSSVEFMESSREFQTYLFLNWKNVRDSLQPEDAAIEFVTFQLYDKKWTGKNQYAALVLRPGMDAPAWIPLCEETVLTNIFTKLDGKTSEEQTQILYDENGSDLYAAIWQPLEEKLDGVETVFYSPSGLLHKINFNAISEKESFKSLGLNLVSSTREVVYRNRKTTQKPSSAVVYGDLLYTVDPDTMKREASNYNTPDDTEGLTNDDLPKDITRGANGLPQYWKRLSGSGTEGETIENILSKENIKPISLYRAAKGNKESFKSLDGKKTTVIHLATHGFFLNDIEKNNEERERLERLIGGKTAFENPLRRSALVLSGANNAWQGRPVAGVENGILFADEVASMNLLDAELVVMSACETGLGVVNNSEGVFGLQRAFKLAGAETIVMSLWTVDDAVTSELMTKFYENWISKGMSKQEAFKAAQRSIREQDKYASSYYWAAFVMID